MPSIRRNTKLAERIVTVLYRYFIKQDYAPKDLRAGDIVLVVKNDKGKQYTVTLRKTKQHECTCPSVKPCYHIKNMVKAENERWQAEKAAKKAEYAMSDAMYTKLAPKTEEVKEVSQEAPVYTNLFKKPRKWVTERVEAEQNRREILAEAREIKERREYAPLNGNRGFSLMR